MNPLSRLTARQKRILLAVMIAVGIPLCAPRLLAEYYYLGVLNSEANPDWFYKLEMLGRSATPVLIRLLGDDEYIYRQFAADSLGRLRDRRAVPRLMEVAADDPDREVRRSAIMALGMIGDDRAVPVLEELSRTTNVAFEPLGNMGEPGREALLRHLRSHPNSDARALAIRALCDTAEKGDTKAQEEVRAAVANPTSAVREEVARCLPRFLQAQAKELLRPLLDDESLLVRIGASEELANLQDRSGFDAAREILLDRSVSEDVRVRAARALGAVRSIEAFLVLRDVYETDPSIVVREGARRNLGQFSMTDVPEEIRRRRAEKVK